MLIRENVTDWTRFMMLTKSDPQEEETVESRMTEGNHVVGYVGKGYPGR